jgi:trehalose-6-phosphatase
VIPRNVAAVSPSTKCSKVGAGAVAPRSWLAVIEAIRVLQQIHAATHPGALIENKNAAVTSHDAQDEQRKAALLATLDAEARDEEE